MTDNDTALRDRTIADFGEQWTTYTDNSGYYGSLELLADIIEPLLPVGDLRARTVADIGSGTGRIVNMLLQAGASKVYAVEPSVAFDVLERNTAADKDRVELLKIRGDQLPSGLGLDYVISLGVMHHIPDPNPAIRAAYAALRPGGTLLVWLYGYEGNELYLATFGRLRGATKRLPHWALAGVARAANVAADAYVVLCKRFRLPLRDYVNNVFGKFSREKRYLVIYDQLNPAFAKYYTEREARNLLEANGFADVRVHHRHGYSWTVAGKRPA